MNSASILVVDDEAIVAMDIESRLQRLGYRTVGPTGTADGAIRLAGEKRPDLALMDINLGGAKDGIDAACALRHEFNIPVVYLTAYADEKTVSRAKSAEPLGYILKPFEERELRAAIEIALHKQKADQTLRRMEKWLTSTLCGIGDGVLTIDRAGRITFMNGIAQTMTEWPADEALGRVLDEVLVVREDRGGKIFRLPVQRALAGELAVEYSDRNVLIGRRGAQYAIDCSVAPIRDDGESANGAVVVLRDMSAARDAERRRKDTEEQSRQHDRMAAVRHLAGGMSHQFNNMLAVILGSGERLKDLLPDGDERSAMVDDILAATERAASLTRMIRAVSGEEFFRRERLDLRALLMGQVDLLQTLVGHDVTVAGSFGVGPMPVEVNRLQFEQAIVKLALRCRDAMPEGGVLRLTADRETLDEATARSMPGLSAGEHVVVKMTDTGPTLPSQALATIFEPVATPATLSLGTWLGLADVFGIVTGNGGAITARNAESQGTAFTIYLPQVAA